MSAISWWRSWHGAPTDHKWPVIAARSGVKPGIVSAVAWALYDHASLQPERGFVGNFDTEEYAVFSGFSETEITAVIQAMTDKGVIVDGKIANWEKYQPRREDDSRERVRKFRDMKRSVTHGNAPEKESDKDTDTDTEGEEDSDPPDLFSKVQGAIEQITGLLPDRSAPQAIREIIQMGANRADIQAGYNWLRDQKRDFKYYSSLVGPTRTAMARRIGANNPNSPPVLTEADLRRSIHI